MAASRPIAPAYAYKPLEIGKGIGANGAMFTFPVVNVTGDLIARSDKFPANFGMKSREWFIKRVATELRNGKTVRNRVPLKLN
ncbi:putative solute-binding protein [Acinetobacter baumannii]